MESAGASFPLVWSGERDSLFKQVLDNLLDGVYFTDRDRRIKYWNHAAEYLTGYSADEVMGKRCSDNFLMHVDGAGRLLCKGACPLTGTIADGRPRRADVYLHHKDGHRVPTEVRVFPIRSGNGEVVGAVEIFNDNSRQRAVREKARELAKLVFLDPAFEVANRRYLDRQLLQHLDHYAKSNSSFGIMLADLDKLKDINDTYGHVVGNAALVTVAKTLSGCSRASDVLGRWGGDEFLMILPGITKDFLAGTCKRCRALVARSTVSIDRIQIEVTISVGATMVAPGDTPESLLERADQHLYKSKRLGRNRVSV